MTETTEVMVREEQSTDIVLPDDLDLSVAGEENLKTGDVGMPPRLRISSQNKPIEGTSPGDIVNTLTGAIYDKVEFVPMVFLPTTRVMWPPNFDAGNIPLCVSDDGEYPLQDTTRATLPLLGPCSTCEFSQFGEDGTPPACKNQRNFLVLALVEDREPAIITLQSTGIAAAKQLTALAKMAGLRKSIIMATRLVSGDKGTWWMPVFVIGRKLAAGEIMTAVDFRDELKNLVITADLVDTNGATPASGDDGPAPVLYDDELDEVPF